MDPNLPFPPASLEAFLAFSKKEEHPKNTVLLREGQVSRKIYFVKKGILRFYYYNEEGKDITHWFLLENGFITEIDSFLKGTESQYYIETLEDCVLHTINYDEFNKLSNVFPESERLWNHLLSKIVIELGEKIKDLQFRDAQTRYTNLISKHPDILLRVALAHVASYLGITQQSLSRIRRQK